MTIYNRRRIHSDEINTDEQNIYESQAAIN